MPLVRSRSSHAHPANLSARLALWTCILLAIFAIPAARAQTAGQTVSVYATASPDYLTRLYTVTGSTPPQSTLTGSWIFGIDAGVTFTIGESDHLVYGVDFRGGPEIGTPGFATALAGFKIGAKAPLFRVKPYSQLSLGFLEQRHQTGTGAYQTYDAESYLAIELFVGADYPVNPHLDLRVLEIGGGFTHVIVTNGVITQSKPDILSVGAGVVLHF